MNKRLIIIGASGLIGKSLIRHIKEPLGFSQIKAYVRKPDPEIKIHPIVNERIFDFNQINVNDPNLKADTLFCSLGTTIKKAGSKSQFHHIDCHIPLEISRILSKNKLKHLILISAIGAKESSPFFYNHVKGKLENKLKELQIDRIDILRPSLLLGQRREHRLAEDWSKKLFGFFKFFIPNKFQAIHADTIAKKTLQLLDKKEKGVFIYEGKDLLPD